MAIPLAEVYRSLSILHGTGRPWPEAVERATELRDPRWQRAHAALARGVTPTEALAGVLPPVDLAGVRAGEASGRLEEILKTLSRRHEEADRRTRETAAATWYPLLLAHVGALLLPIPDLVAGRPGRGLLWSLAILAPVYAFLVARRLARRAAERAPSPGTRPGLLHLFLSKAAVLEADARSLAALGWLHDAGVPHLEAVPLAAAAGAGGRIAADLARAEAAVREGRPLASAWREAPEEVRGSLVTGESTGRLAEACAHGATLLEEMAALRRAKALALLKPVAILVLGAVIGARVLSFYAAAFSAIGR